MLTSEGWTFQGNHVVAVGLPALKRSIKVEALSRSAKALLPPHECGGSHHESRSFPVVTQTLVFGILLGCRARAVAGSICACVHGLVGFL
jgi:hypothetical protein